MNLQVTVFEIADAGKLKGRARVILEDDTTGFRMQIDGLRVIDDGVKRPWVALPQDSYWRDDQKHYKDLLRLNDIARETIFSRVLAEYKKLQNPSSEMATTV